MESHGNAYTAPHRVPPGAGLVGEGGRPQVGPAASRNVDFRGLGVYARAHILLSGPREAHVGDHLVFPAARLVFDG